MEIPQNIDQNTFGIIILSFIVHQLFEQIVQSDSQYLSPEILWLGLSRRRGGKKWHLPVMVLIIG